MSDVPDALNACLGSRGVILTEFDLGPDFFDLGTRLAGELMQKFVNYRLKMAVVVPQPERYGERFCELAREHRTHPEIRFIETEAKAREWLSSEPAS
ncbi:MAG: DUF4180 domain-containing protein [Pseudomonadales bacterium]|nr:DUF4180 domain-containing protein [Pseudomonadales bacterium]